MSLQPQLKQLYRAFLLTMDGYIFPTISVVRLEIGIQDAILSVLAAIPSAVTQHAELALQRSSCLLVSRNKEMAERMHSIVVENV